MKCFIQGYPADNWKYWNSVWLGGDWEKYLRKELLQTQRAHNSRVGLVKRQILNLEVWGGPQASAFLTSSQVTVMMLTQGPHWSQATDIRVTLTAPKLVKIECTGHLLTEELPENSVYRATWFHNLNEHELWAAGGPPSRGANWAKSLSPWGPWRWPPHLGLSCWENLEPRPQRVTVTHAHCWCSPLSQERSSSAAFPAWVGCHQLCLTAC